jgi:hypothetical protein
MLLAWAGSGELLGGTPGRKDGGMAGVSDGVCSSRMPAEASENGADSGIVSV